MTDAPAPPDADAGARKRDDAQFARDGLMLVVSSGLAGLLFMLVHVVLGRRMPEGEYSSFVALLGLLNILSVPSGALTVVMARYVAEFAHGRAVSRWVTLLRRALRRVTLLGGLGLLAWAVASLWLVDFLKAPSVSSLVMVGVVALASLYGVILNGTLQGAQRFAWMAGSSIIVSLGRLILCTIVVLAGGGVSALLGGVVASTILGVAFAAWPCLDELRTVPPEAGMSTGPVYRYFGPVLAGHAILFVLLNIDTVLSARFLAGDNFAAYGKAAMLARLVLFLPLPIAAAMFPRAVGSSGSRVLLTAFLPGFALAALAALAITAMPDLPMRLMYGVTGALYTDLVRAYVWAALPLAAISLVSPFLWARDRAGGILLLAPVAVGYVAALFLYHETPMQMVLCLAIGGWLAAIVLILLALRRTG